MRLLLLGALGPYPERLSSFIADGHQIWWVNTLPPGPPPEDVPGVAICALSSLATGGATEHAADGLVTLIAREHIEVVYSLLNIWDGSVQITAALLRHGCPVPLVRHYKEHYMQPWDDERLSIEQATGAIFINAESREYFAGVYRLPARTACVDPDLLPRRYLAGPLQPKLSAGDHRPHLLIAGTVTDDGGRYDYRPLIAQLTAHGAHVHLYGLFKRMQPNGQMPYSAEVEATYRGLTADGLLHLHAPVPPARFVEAWSPYDAGLLHMRRDDDRFRALNIPNRYSAYLAAGVPVAMPRDSMPAMQRRLTALGGAILYEEPGDLVARLPDGDAAARALQAREAVTAEAVYPEIMRFLTACVG
ncbi:MAG TPA: hypothetical protein VM536_00710 [Chloroflexia bacterium]|nr:hypothetical protein [Chloroflexia bacterium]